ncbi:hypothetical protein GCM10009630_33390 [Kribbella jejuensis]
MVAGDNGGEGLLPFRWQVAGRVVQVEEVVLGLEHPDAGVRTDRPITFLVSHAFKSVIEAAVETFPRFRICPWAELGWLGG